MPHIIIPKAQSYDRDILFVPITREERSEAELALRQMDITDQSLSEVCIDLIVMQRRTNGLFVPTEGDSAYTTGNHNRSFEVMKDINRQIHAQLKSLSNE